MFMIKLGLREREKERVTPYLRGCWASMVGVRLGLWLSHVQVFMFISQLGLCFMWQAQLAWSHWRGWWMWMLCPSIIWEECACTCILCAWKWYVYKSVTLILYVHVHLQFMYGLWTPYVLKHFITKKIIFITFI